MICSRCGQSAFRHGAARSGLCEPCMRKHRADGRRASAEVTKAIRAGLLKPAREHVCADCESQARDWDHRDYLRPLDVQAVCKPCNLRRGVAFDSACRPDGEVAPPIFETTDRRTTRHHSTNPPSVAPP